MANDPLLQQAASAVDQVRIPNFRNKLQTSLANGLPEEMSSEMNRTLDNPDEMEKIRKQLQDERDAAGMQDTKTLMLTGLISALGGLFGAEQAGPAGAAAGLTGGFNGANAGVDLQNALKTSREKEEEVDKLRRERLGILSSKEELRLKELNLKEKTENRKQAMFDFKKGIDERDYNLRLDNFKARLMRMGQLNEKEQGDIAARWNDTLRKDKIYSELLEQDKAGDSLLDLVQQARNGSVLSGAALSTAAARASGQVGVLTDRDLAIFGGRQDVLNRIERWEQLATTGKPLTGADLIEFEKLGQGFKDIAQRKMIEVEDSFIAKFAAERGKSRSTVENVIRADKKPATPAKTPAKPTLSREEAIAEWNRRYPNKAVK